MPSQPTSGISYGEIDLDYAKVLATTPEEQDGPVLMVNLMKYRQMATYADGRESTISGKEADDRYAPVAILAELGAQVALFADVLEQVDGGAPVWDRVGIVRYPTRRSFIDMQSRSDFQEKHDHKEAGMESTIIVGCLPEGDGALGEGELLLMRVDRTAGDASAPAGALSFDVEGTIVGDGRSWSRVSFEAHGSIEDAVAAAAVRPAASEDSYALVLRPMIDELR